MVFKTRRELETLRAQQEDTERAAKEHKIQYVRDTLRTIRFAVENGFPACPRSDVTLDEFRSTKPQLRRSFKGDVVFKAGRFNDGAGLDFFTPDDFLEIGRHRLIIPAQGKAEYSRRSVRADIQMIPTPPVEAVGAEAIAEVDYIQETLGYCLGAIAVERTYEWENAYRLQPSQNQSKE